MWLAFVGLACALGTSLPLVNAATGLQPGYGIADFTPIGPGTAWALAVGDGLRDPSQSLVRSEDAGARWSDVTPPGLSRQSAARRSIRLPH